MIVGVHNTKSLVEASTADPSSHGEQPMAASSIGGAPMLGLTSKDDEDQRPWGTIPEPLCEKSQMRTNKRKVTGSNSVPIAKAQKVQNNLHMARATQSNNDKPILVQDGT